jgi:hypothetical protein
MGKKAKKEKKVESEYEGDENLCSCGESCSCGDDCNCGCDSDEETPHIHRRFYTKAEQIEMLEDYLTDLKAEAAGVEEALAELKK